MSPLAIALIVIACIAVLVAMCRPSGSVSATGTHVCPSCGTRGSPMRSNKGNLLIEIILWLCFIVPGLIYSIWRLSNRTGACPACGGAMIPVATPRGQQMVQHSRESAL